MMLSSDKESLWTRVVGIVIKAGLGMGASLLLRPEYLAAQSQPLIQKKDPIVG